MPFDSRPLLAIPISHPEWLFRSPQYISSTYRRLAKTTHPDSGGTAEAFQHLMALKVVAESWPSWTFPLSFSSVRWWHDSISFNTMALTKGHTFLNYCIASHARDAIHLPPSTVATVRKFVSALAPSAATNACARMLPQETQGGVGRASTGIPVSPGIPSWIVESPRPLIRLADLLAFFGGHIPVPHASWIISRLLDFCCLMEASGCVHGGLLEENVYVHPPSHDITILGGWEFSAKAGERMAPFQDSRVVGILSPTTRFDKQASPFTDIALVRRLGNVMLGRQVVGIPFAPSAPQPLLDWLDCVGPKNFFLTSASASRNLGEWQWALDAAGGRRFSPLSITPAQVYNI